MAARVADLQRNVDAPQEVVGASRPRRLRDLFEEPPEALDALDFVQVADGFKDGCFVVVVPYVEVKVICLRVVDVAANKIKYINLYQGIHQMLYILSSYTSLNSSLLLLVLTYSFFFNRE